VSLERKLFDSPIDVEADIRGLGIDGGFGSA